MRCEVVGVVVDGGAPPVIEAGEYANLKAAESARVETRNGGEVGGARIDDAENTLPGFVPSKPLAKTSRMR